LISKQQYEAQLQQIFRLLLENKSQEEIARELHISTRTVARYSQRIEKRYGQMQRQKTDDTIFMESQLFKNRMLTLYKALENQVILDNKTSGVEKAKCAEIASEIALDILRLEAESVKAIRDIEIGHNGNNVIKGQHYLENLRSKKSKINNNDNDYKFTATDNEEDCDPNRKF
jgi:Sigma-70, region 4